MIAILYFGTIYGLETLGSSTIWKPSVRGLLADYAYVVCGMIGSPNLESELMGDRIDWNFVLGGIRSYPGQSEGRQYHQGAGHLRLPPNPIA